jgi:hypothetical protein
MIQRVWDLAREFASTMTSKQLTIGILGLSVSYYVTGNTVPLFCLLILALVYVMRPGILGPGQTETKTTIRENNQIKKKTIYLNSELDGYLRDLRKYKRYNRTEYTEGTKYLKMFQSNLHDLTRDDMAHPRQVFENAQLYLTLGLNHFHAITFSIPENNYNSTLKYNKTISQTLVRGLSSTCKDMYEHCYALLVSESERLNVDFRDNPDMYKAGIVLTPGNVKAFNEVSGRDMF